MRFALLMAVIFLYTHVHAVCVSDNEVELKVKPDAKAKSSWVVGRYMPLVEIGRKGAFRQVSDMDGSKHWIHARHLTSKYNCVIVRSDTANLRLGPGTQYPQTDLSYVRKYAVFKKVDRDEEWIKVQDEFGQYHWMHEQTLWEPRLRTKVTFQ
ncbi:MAG: hypothetical protein IT287_06220 [Bdellovibrionaceae bacterium]|nr:hypothetical protein [Pseudobdellovibrionaceae bacterium]